MKKETAAKPKMLLTLFLNMLYLSAFTFGGGFVIVSLMKKKFVDKYGWLTDEEMLDITALSETCPGAIAVNASVLVGYRLCGFAGMAVSVAGTVLPPLAILLAVSFFYGAFSSNVYVSTVLKGMQAAVAAVILDVVCSLGSKLIKNKSALDTIVFIAAFSATFIFNINVIYIIIAAAVIGIVKALVFAKKERRNK